ncbi:MAG: hypothetical protein KIT68_09325 [Phycisphaeraceae bacterium]|nr:hypothetical protein [Phycisphaeraceae bacterium]
MALTIVGIDEAGYGPMLGPLCVGVAALRVDAWSPGGPAPDLWEVLGAGVCRKPGDKRGRIAVEDSKKLKLANDSRRHPLTHLERGVMAFLSRLGHAPTDDAQLLAALRARGEGLPWYAVDPVPVPLGGDAALLAIAGNTLGKALTDAGVGVLDVGCRVVGERAFNRAVRERGSKAEATAIGLRDHLTAAWEKFGAEPGDDHGPRIVCDRQGGRQEYAELLAELVPGLAADGVTILEQRPERSRYLVRGVGSDGAPRRMTVMFQPEAESACLPVALASMTAKLVRELLMGRFNRYWQARAAAAGIAELKPTAGYVTDARRWLKDASALISRDERRDMVRIA